MSRVWRYRPSPAMIVATLALFVAMGGTGYAVSKLPKGSVGPAQLRKNAVRSQHIKARSITRAKLAQSAITALRDPAPAGVAGPVTSSAASDRVGFADRAGYADKAGFADKSATADRAAQAASATTAALASQAENAAALGGRSAAQFITSDAIRWIEPFTIGEGTKPMLEAGPFTLTARCRLNDRIDDVEGQDQADIIISTTQPRSAFDGEDLLGHMDPSTNMESRQFVDTAVAPTGKAKFEASSDGLALGGDGKLYIKGSYLFAAVNVNGDSGKCKFGGYVFL